jgi:hypothetical protein
MGDFQVEDKRFYTKEENDDFASGLELMGAKEIITSYYDRLLRSWCRYQGNITFMEKEKRS